MSAALEFRSVTRTFGDGPHQVTALNDVSLAIEPGVIFGIVGESGAGKSTLLRMMNGLDHPTSGQVLFEGHDLATLSKREMNRVRHSIGVVFQAFNLVSNLTVRENIELPLKLQRRSAWRSATARGTRASRAEYRRDSTERALEMASFVGLADRLDHYPAQLSGGQKQRVAIARALVAKPSLLLCDEPTSALDTHTASELLELLRATREEFGTSITLVTHELDAVRAICDTAAVLEGGVVRDTITVSAPPIHKEQSYIDHVRSELTR